MIITDTSSATTFNAIYRTEETYAASQLIVRLVLDGTITEREYTPTGLSYKPNHVEISFELGEDDPDYKDGQEYTLRLCDTSYNLLFMDKVVITDGTFVSTKQSMQNDTASNDYVTPVMAEDEDDDYVILGSPNTGTAGSGSSSSTDTSSDDTDNDGYGNITRLGSMTPVTNSFNIMGEFTIDESQYGTFQTADAYTEYTVKDVNVRQPSDVGTQPFYSQQGLADGFDGYVKYRQGYDEIVANFGFRNDMLSYPVDSGGTVADYVVSDSSYLPANWDMKIYLDSTKTDITVGDSIYSDDEGTPLNDGTTNGKTNREWFLWTDGDIVKTTGGVVTHKYNYKDQDDEKWIQFVTASHLKKQTYDGSTVTYLEDGQVGTVGKQWQGNGPTGPAPLGSLVTVLDIDTAASTLQTKLNDGWAIVPITHNQSKIYDTFDFSQTDPFGVGEQVYTRELGFNAGRRLSSDIIAKTQPTSVYLEDLDVTIDYSYKSGETVFAYCPTFGSMTSNFNFPNRRGIVLIEYDKYTGIIINKRSIYRTNN